MNEINYTIGDEIVSLKNHSQGIFKEGDIFKCLDLQYCICGCGGLNVYIGHKPSAQLFKCNISGRIVPYKGSKRWFLANAFTKIYNDKISELIEESISLPVLILNTVN